MKATIKHYYDYEVYLGDEYLARYTDGFDSLSEIEFLTDLKELLT